jgi:hypothetical protein
MHRLSRLEEMAPKILLLAGTLVGVAIVLDGTPSRTVNGVAGILWFLAAGLLVRSVLRAPARWIVLGSTVVVAFVLVLAVRPSDLLWAAAGFVAGGALVGLVARADRERAALLLPAVWLPLHLAVAVGRAIDRAMNDLPATVRADPPPTAALVPLTMVVAAYAGGLLAEAGLSRYRARRAIPTRA